MTLTIEQIQRKQDLTQKLETRVLTPPEANELTDLLEQEKKDALSLGDFAKALAVIFLIGLVIAYLTDEN